MAPNRTMMRAPAAMRISGSTGPNAGMVRAGFIVTSVCGDSGRFHGGERSLDVVEKRLRRCCEDVKDRTGLHAVVDDEQDERREGDDLATVQVGDRLERRLVEFSV